MNSPPSENESGVTLSTPITAGIGRPRSVRSTSGPAEPAAATDGEGEAFMRQALAVGEWESRRDRAISRSRRSEGVLGSDAIAHTPSLRAQRSNPGCRCGETLD